MSRPIPKCRFCGKDLRRAAARIIVDEGPRGARKRWGCCAEAKCLMKFAAAGSESPRSAHLQAEE